MVSKKSIGVKAVETAAGWVGIAWSQEGLVAINLPEPDEAAALRRLPETSGPAPQAPPGLDVHGLADRLRRYFLGEGVRFDEPLDPSLGTAFQRQVWALTRAIPRGETRTYGQLARLAGHAGSARAVGQAMARNPWPVIVPCHRVVGHDGRLTGFGGGLALKQHMLEMEAGLMSSRI
ncbi:MAG: methylated-DNA--[protein]-cysteine S-methyltransferase [Anaerolineaceae bacterium]|nr:methylated-DNA--[protein]-cysteine S-methyltransferase [Anaerolineaceae bacterium]